MWNPELQSSGNAYFAMDEDRELASLASQP